jgi:hypothetical protein
MSGDGDDDEQLLYLGLRCIGALRRSGRQWQAFAGPAGGASLGTFDKHQDAARAVYDADVIERLAGAASRSKGDA